MSSRETLQRKDLEASEAIVVTKGSTHINKDVSSRKSGSEEKYDQLLSENKLLFTLDIIKELLSEAYKAFSEPEMANQIAGIIAYATYGNRMA